MPSLLDRALASATRPCHLKATALALALAAATAGAAEPAPAPEVAAAPTLEPALALTPPPAPTHRWRAAAEIGSVLALGALSYTFSPSPSGANSDKWDGVRFDANPFKTNFAAHPLSGTFYYQVARSNGLAAWEASLWAVGSSTAWELIEVREPVSLNDLITTPTAGVAIGAPLGELSDWLAARGHGPWSTAASWVLGLPQRFNDVLDGRRAGGAGGEGVLSAGVSAGLALARVGPDWRPELRLAGGWELIRDEGWGRPGRGTRALLDASVSGLELRGALRAPGGGADFALLTHVHLAALHGRELTAGAQGPEGTEWLLGAGPAFLYRAHAWGLGSPMDRLSVVELPRLAATWRVTRGDAGLTLAGAAAPSFGGVHSLALQLHPEAAPPESLPAVQNAYGYHFAAGVAAQASASARWGRWSALVEGRSDLLWGLLDPDANVDSNPTADLDERWSGWRGLLAFLPCPGLSLSAGYEQQWRRSSAGATVVTAGERAFALSVGWVR